MYLGPSIWIQKETLYTQTLIKITETIRKALDKDDYACGIFIDLQKAFDTVNHEILIDKLNHYGIRSVGNRSQYVSIQGFYSSAEKVKYGVPQGSLLDPLFFLIYIIDLQSHQKQLSLPLRG